VRLLTPNTRAIARVHARPRRAGTKTYWRRPQEYLDESVRANMSTFALLDERVVADGVPRLARDLADRSWHRRYGSLLTLSELDVGYRLVVAELN
jgi:hypothetical protein